MAQQTAVEWLNHELWSLRLQLRGGEISIEDFGKKMVVRLAQAKQMEREQIIKAHKDGNKHNCWALRHEHEQYYTETFGNNQNK